MAWRTPWVLQNAHRYPDDHDGLRLYRRNRQVGRDGCTIMGGDVCIVFPSMLLVKIDYFHRFYSYAAGGPICQTDEDESFYHALELVGVARKVQKKGGHVHTRLLWASHCVRALQRAWRARRCRRRVAACGKETVWNKILHQKSTLDHIVLLAEGEGSLAIVWTYPHWKTCNLLINRDWL